jgi:hypothetical protein
MSPLPNAAGRRGTILGAFLTGWRQVLRAPALTAGVLVATVLMGSWTSEFWAAAEGTKRTLTHEVLGFGGALAMVSDVLSSQAFDPALAGLAASYLGLWIFVSGGLLDRVARGRPVGTAAFFSACGRYFGRLLRLAAIVGAAYWSLFGWLHPWLFGTVFGSVSGDLATGQGGTGIRVVLPLAFTAALMLVGLVADFARVRAVVEDRRSVIGALTASLRFIRRRPWRVSGLYLLSVVTLLLVLGLGQQTTSSAGPPSLAGPLLWLLFLLARLWAKLAFMASEVVFFQGELAHAEYTALPEPIWPDSPAVEAMENLRGPRRSYIPKM